MNVLPPVAFHDLPAASFPFVVKFNDADTGELLHTMTIDGPGAVTVPGFAPHRVDVTIAYPDGTTHHQPAPSEGQQ